MKKTFLAAILCMALFTGCSNNNNDLTNENVIQQTGTPVIASTVPETTTTTATIVSEVSEATTDMQIKNNLHNHLCQLYSENDESEIMTRISNISLSKMWLLIDDGALETDSFDLEPTYIDYEPSDVQKQLLLNYLISHNLSPANDKDYSFFSIQGSRVDTDNVVFAVLIEVPNNPVGMKLVFSKDKTVVGVKGNLAGDSDNYYQLEDVEQLQFLYDIVEQYRS